MATFEQIDSLRSIFRQIEHSNTQLQSVLRQMPCVQLCVQEVPQFARDADLPAVIQPIGQSVSVDFALRQAVEPQQVFQYNHNLPKRFAGIIQLSATKRQYDAVAERVSDSTLLRKELVSKLNDYEPVSRRRSRLTKALFPDILFQTMMRRIPLAPFDTSSVSLSWCEEQKSLKKLSTDQALQFIDSYYKGVSDRLREQNRQRIESVTAVFKSTNVRVHPQLVYRHIVNDKACFTPKKVHSPLIVLTSHSEPISFTALGPYTQSANEHRNLKGYKTLFPGTCLVYRVGDMSLST
ncbi:DNA replication terminus site-binding protein [Vibrio sp.]|uniref:DNA replication terminus site-binding protein n=1 Tax=Vibrio sp. TaxID=678 RepID=UPI003D0C6530